MTTRILLEGAGYRYPSAADAAVADVNLNVGPGELVLVTGPTGCGKSTLLRLVAGLLQRHGEGEVAGRFRVNGQDPGALKPSERVLELAFVAQEPSDQIATALVGDELAFALESAGMGSDETAARLPQVAADVGLQMGFERATTALSGGQTQRLTLGAGLSAGAQVLLLDEPLAHVDSGGAQDIMAHLRKLVDDGTTALVVEHRLEACLRWCTRVVVMTDGGVALDTPVSALTPGSAAVAQMLALGLNLPGALELAHRLAPQDPAQCCYALTPTTPPPAVPAFVQMTDLRWTWPGASQPAVDGVDFAAGAGERIAIVGGNGVGKSTLLGLVGGQLGPGADVASVSVPQDPDLALFCETVRDELAYAPREQGLPASEVSSRVQVAADALSLTDLLDRAPHALSRGQRLRCAVGAALASRPKLLILDEPTAGQDFEQVERMMDALGVALADGALVFATHDLGLALRHATRVLVIHDGRVAVQGPPSVVLRTLPQDSPLVLPELARFCLERGLRPVSAAVLASSATAGSMPIQPLVATQSVVVRDTPEAQVTAHPGLLDPRTRLGLIALAGIVAVTLDSAISLGLFTLVALMPMVVMRVSWMWWRRGLIAAAVILWSTALSQGLFYSEDPRVSLFHLGPVHVYREGVLHGLVQSLRFIALSLCGVGVAVSTPPDRLFAALVRLRIPFGLALMGATALRFLPEVTREALTVRRARASRGRAVWRRAPWAWLALEVGLLRPTVARCWRRAQNLAESLDARGFDPTATRPMRRPLRFRPVDGAILLSTTAVVSGLVVARVLFLLYTSDLVYWPSLLPLYAFTRSWL